MARGIIPGSLNEVLNRLDTTKRNSTAATTGIAGLTFSPKYGQSQAKKMVDVTTTRPNVK